MSKGNKWGAKALDAAVCLGAPKIPIAGIGSLMIEDGFVRRMVVCCATTKEDRWFCV